MAAPGAYVAQYENSIVSLLDIHKPEKFNELYLKYDNQGLNFFLTLNSHGFHKPVAQGTYSHWEDDFIHQTIKVKAIVADPGAGVDITFALHADSVDGGKYYVRPWDQILFNNEVTGLVTGIVFNSPDYEVTVKLNNETLTFGALAAGETLTILGNAFSEGSGQPNGRLTKAYEVENCTQIFKETNEGTGTEMTNQPWFETTEKGAKIPTYYHKGLMDMEFRHTLAMSGALLFSQKNTNTGMIDSDTGRVVNTTEGLVPYMRSNAQSMTLGAGTFAVSDLDTADALLTKQFAPKYMCIQAGINRHQAIENGLVTYFANTDIDYTRKVMNKELFGNNDSLAASVNYSLITKSNRTFAIKRMNELSNPQMYNHADSLIPEMALMIPLGKTKDAKGNMSTHVGYRYKEHAGYSRKSEIWSTGSAGAGPKTNDLDVRNTHNRSEIGGHWMKGNQMLLIATT